MLEQDKGEESLTFDEIKDMMNFKTEQQIYDLNYFSLGRTESARTNFEPLNKHQKLVDD